MGEWTGLERIVCASFVSLGLVSCGARTPLSDDNRDEVPTRTQVVACTALHAIEPPFTLQRSSHYIPATPSLALVAVGARVGVGTAWAEIDSVEYAVLDPWVNWPPRVTSTLKEVFHGTIASVGEFALGAGLDDDAAMLVGLVGSSWELYLAKSVKAGHTPAFVSLPVTGLPQFVVGGNDEHLIGWGGAAGPDVTSPGGVGRVRDGTFTVMPWPERNYAAIAIDDGYLLSQGPQDPQSREIVLSRWTASGGLVDTDRLVFDRFPGSASLIPRSDGAWAVVENGAGLSAARVGFDGKVTAAPISLSQADASFVMAALGDRLVVARQRWDSSELGLQLVGDFGPLGPELILPISSSPTHGAALLGSPDGSKLLLAWFEEDGEGWQAEVRRFDCSAD